MPASRPLLVVATRAEAAHLSDRHEVLLTGIGKTAAATALTRRLAVDPDPAGLQVVNVGTAGALREDVEPHGGIYRPGVVLNHEISGDALRSLGYDPRERLTLTGGDPELVLATGDLFVTDPVLRDVLAARASLVDMEGYAIAYVAAEFGVPVQLVKHVSDQADESAMDWNTAVDHSARILADWVDAHL